MRMRRFWTPVLPAFTVLALVFPAPVRAQSTATPTDSMAGHGAEHTTASSGPLKIIFGEKSEEWTPSTLASLPHVSVNVFNEHAKANQSYSGVRLSDLLYRLGVPDKPRGKDFRLYLVARGEDGYAVVYSLGEVTPDVHDGTTIVADTMDGKPLGSNGPFQMVMTGEKRPARWVHNLASIRVLTAE